MMLVTSKINIDLVRGTPSALLMTHQGDVYTRAVEVSLFADGSPWPVPGCEVAVRYLKPDGTGGMYNKLPDDTVACSVSENKILARLAPQMFSIPGHVRAELQLYTQTEVLHTFAFDLLVHPAAASAEHSEDYYYLLPIRVIGDLNSLDTNAKENLVSAVNEVNQKVAGLSKGIVKSVNGTQPDETGDVKILADDLDVEIEEFQYQGSIVGAVKTLYGLSVLKVNGKTPNKDGVLALTSDSIPMDDGAYQWGPISVTQAIEQTWGKIPSDSKINGLILALLKSYAKTVNGVAPGEDGNVLLESDNIQMSDGEYGWAGSNVTQALEEVNSNIPGKAVIDGYIDAKIKELPPCVKDVKINSTSVVTKEEANIALSGALQFVSRILGITPTTDENITQRVQTRALTLNKLDSAVKAAMCDGTGAAWTEAEQAAARERIGIKSVEGVLF